MPCDFLSAQQLNQDLSLPWASVKKWAVFKTTNKILRTERFPSVWRHVTKALLLTDLTPEA